MTTENCNQKHNVTENTMPINSPQGLGGERECDSELSLSELEELSESELRQVVGAAGSQEWIDDGAGGHYWSGGGHGE